MLPYVCRGWGKPLPDADDTNDGFRNPEVIERPSRADPFWMAPSAPTTRDRPILGPMAVI